MPLSHPGQQITGGHHAIPHPDPTNSGNQEEESSHRTHRDGKSCPLLGGPPSLNDKNKNEKIPESRTPTPQNRKMKNTPHQALSQTKTRFSHVKYIIYSSKQRDSSCCTNSKTKEFCDEGVGSEPHPKGH